jgi:hypothetical protein
LGSIGIGELTSFETIVDYTHKRLVLIRLDSAGHRLAPAPDYTPVDSLPLISVDNGHVAVVGHIGTVIDTLALDTGSPVTILTPATRQRVQPHINGLLLDSLVLGKRTFTKLVLVPAMSYMPSIVGYPVLSQFGVIGINQRTHQLLLYR